jgi:hypothetical protein
MKPEEAWPNSGDMKDRKERPGLFGLYTFAGHFKQPRQQGGIFLAGAGRLVHNDDLLVVPGTGYAMGLVGLRHELKIKAGQTVTLPVIFISANADDPAKPQMFDFRSVALALKNQLAGQMGDPPFKMDGAPGLEAVAPAGGQP